MHQTMEMLLIQKTLSQVIISEAVHVESNMEH